MPADTATPIAIDQLGQVFGPTIGYYIARCRHGGYLVIVDGTAHSAHSALSEAIGAMGKVAADQYGEAAQPPERARDVTPAPRDARDEPLPPGDRPRIVHPPQTGRPAPSAPAAGLAERAAATALVLLGLLAVGVRGVVGV
jgi:hypothetical protein